VEEWVFGGGVAVGWFVGIIGCRNYIVEIKNRKNRKNREEWKQHPIFFLRPVLGNI
jgi:hypothetical protein